MVEDTTNTVRSEGVGELSGGVLEESSTAIDIRERFKDFIRSFRDKSGRLKYIERLRSMILLGQRSLIIDFVDLLIYDQLLARMVIDEPIVTIKAASQAVKELVQQESREYAEQVSEFFVRFRNLPETISIRNLKSEYIGKMVQIEGILVRSTPIRQQLRIAVLKLPDGREVEVPQEGDFLEIPPELEKVGIDVEGKGRRTGTPKLILEKSKFIDWQKVVVQERPEEMPPGQLPRSIEVVLKGDLVDVARPGDRIVLTGILKVKQDKPVKKGSKITFEMYIEGNYVEVLQKALEEVEITKEDEKAILELAKDPNIHEKIVKSIAPAIYGYDDIKKAIALALFGGVPKVLKDGTRIRGDIHILIIGDPGTAKSQLLQYASRIAPRGVYTTGKGSTAAGLTATVLRDKRTGEYYLEAGALVLADGGLCAIDEIDKMRPEDRVAIHEALEQQTISIAKAGIVARLNARTTVIAAGNPALGRYIPDRPLTDNINLPVTILSRFDLIFILQDKPNEEFDTKLAEHILKVHKEAERVRAPIDPELLKKYICYARRYVFPKLTDEAAKRLREFYVSMRKKSENANAPITITARQLEALVRLAEAHARMALRSEVTVEDAEEAIRLMKVFLNSAGIDVETGDVDIDTIMTGKSRSQRERISQLIELINQMLEENDYKPIEVKELKRRAAKLGLKADFVEKALRMLLREGTLYEPKPGYISRAY